MNEELIFLNLISARKNLRQQINSHFECDKFSKWLHLPFLLFGCNHYSHKLSIKHFSPTLRENIHQTMKLENYKHQQCSIVGERV